MIESCTGNLKCVWFWISQFQILRMVDFKIHSKTLEDFLATDGLFVEYFNTFLSLPSFPEPLCFNEETGGFEVVSNAKKDLARQIKAAVRSQQKKNKIYEVTKWHSFIDIPLIPIEESDGQEKLEIDTVFTVTTLNKEQGIHWIKAERLPAFLESDCYLEYRLGKILSQARLTGDSGEFAIMKIDFKPRVKKSKKKVEEVEEEDPKDKLIREMFVSLGTVEGTDSGTWFTQAQAANNLSQTFTTLSRPLSSSRPTSGAIRPRSGLSTAESYRRPDSGLGSPMKSSVFSSSYFGSYIPGLNGTEELDDELLRTKIYLDSKPTTPRPSDPCCVLTGDQNQVKQPSGLMYAYPKTESTDSESGMGDTDRDEADFEPENNSPTNVTQETESLADVNESTKSESHFEDAKKTLVSTKQSSTESIVVNNIDDLGSVIVGAVLKRCIANMTGRDELEVECDEQISSLFGNSNLSYITLEMLDHVSFPEKTEDETPEEDSEDKNDNKKGKEEEESDVDSLLDSEEDYEEGDEFFRKHKNKSYDLSNRKGIQQFKVFLRGTVGEKYFKFWVDIDRSHLFRKNADVSGYLSGMRDRYQRTGAPYELSKELKHELGLVEPSQWTIRRLHSIQNKIAEPLITYWAPRFLLKEMKKINPEKYYLYHQQQQIKQKRADINPSPATKSLLPLRPKSCQPRIHTAPIIQDAITLTYNQESTLKTSPPVGMRRTYTHLQPKPPVTPPTNAISSARTKKKPKELLEPKLRQLASKRCQSAFSRTSSLRPKSSHPTARPISAISVSSNETWESASVNILPETPQPSNVVVEEPVTSRPQTREATRCESKTSTTSKFLGGQRMEALLQALENEKSAGGFFMKFVERSADELWINCLHFWLDVQDYRDLFYKDIIEPYKLEKTAQFIYSKYIVESAPCDILCNGNNYKEVRADIYYQLSPPFEELFDAGEEYCLEVLYSAWLENLKEDVKTYNKVELIDVKRHLETKSKYVLNLQKRGIIKERVRTPDNPMSGYADPVYDPNLINKIPEEFLDLTLEKLVHNRIELEYFREFLAENYASMDLMCWMDIEAWRRISHTDDAKRDQKAKEIKSKYLNKKYFFGPNSPAGKDGQEKVMNAGGGWGKLLEDRPPNAVILEAQKYVRERLEKKWFPLFLTSEDFAERQKIDESMADVVDDVMVQKRRRSQAVWKLLESRWTSSSKEIVMIRKALQNPTTSHLFRRYVSIKGDNLENDVLFWQEVQKYKEMYHAHIDDVLINQKINAIINCFIDSQIPPSIQIDIPHDMAEKIVDRKHEKGPYLFREAQLAVFRVLSAHWDGFCEFRSNLADDKVLPTIERQRRHAKKKELRKQRELEERLEKNKRERESQNDLYDPFKKLNEESLIDEEEYQEKERVTWTYSNYMKALDEEDILNNTNESIFSSVSDLSTLQDPAQSSIQRSTSAHSTSDQNATGPKATCPEEMTSVSKSPTEEKSSVEEQPKKIDLGVRSTGSAKVKTVSVERTTSEPATVTFKKPPSPPVSKGSSETKHVRYSRAMPPLVKPREK